MSAVNYSISYRLLTSSFPHRLQKLFRENLRETNRDMVMGHLPRGNSAYSEAGQA